MIKTLHSKGLKVFSILTLFVLSSDCFSIAQVKTVELEPSIDGPCGISFKDNPLKITPRTNNKFDKYQSSQCITSGMEIKQFLSLLRNHESKIVAVVLNNKGTGLLNPEMKQPINIEYGNIPKITMLSKKDCERLWGAPETTKNNEETFKLLGQACIVDARPSEYYIDTKFVGDKIERYRIRNESLKQSNWVEVR